MTPVRDEFLSEEDLDLKNLTDRELVAYWNQWLEQAQATNDADAQSYSHGVFACAPPTAHWTRGTEERPAQRPNPPGGPNHSHA
jgi:hypothetical protein